MKKLQVEELLLLIRKTREEKGISQRDMAKYLGIAQSSYNQIESGSTALKVETLLEIADYLGINFFPNPNDAVNEDLIALNPVDIVTKISKIDGIDEKVNDLNSKLDKLIGLFGKDKKK